MKHRILLIAFLLIGSFVISAQSLSDTLNIEEVVVTGSRVEIARKSLPVNVTVLNNDDIDEIQESAVLPMISRRVPSVFVSERGVTGFGYQSGSISIRGVGGSPNAQVLVLVDGHPQYMGIFGHPLPNNYVASDLDRVEIIRGPASILYGSNAMGGVMNFITKDQEKEGLTGNLRLGYGSFNTQKYMASTGYKKGKFSFFGSVNHDKTDGHRDSSSFIITNGFIKAGYKLNEHLEASADFNIADFRSIDPGRTDQTVNAFIADMTRGKASLSIRNKYERFEGGLFGFFNYGDHSFSDNWRSHDENYGWSVYQGLKLFKGSLITAGLDFKTFGGRGNIAFPPANANKWLYVQENAGYLIARQSIKNVLDISAGMRLENNSLFGTEWVPQFGMAYHVTKNLSLKASASEGFRSPTIMELYLFAPNPGLKPENIRNYEGGVEGRFMDGKLHAELTLYYLEGSNIILSQPNPTPPPPFKRFNTGEFKHKGIEVETSWKPSDNLDIDLTYSYLSMDAPKLVAPRHQAYAGASYKMGQFAFNAHLSYAGDLLVLDAVNDADDVYESFLLINAGIKYYPKTWLELFVSGKNLGNAEYMIDNGYPMPGINVMTGVGLKF